MADEDPFPDAVVERYLKVQRIFLQTDQAGEKESARRRLEDLEKKYPGIDDYCRGLTKEAERARDRERARERGAKVPEDDILADLVEEGQGAVRRMAGRILVNLVDRGVDAFNQALGPVVGPITVEEIMATSRAKKGRAKKKGKDEDEVEEEEDDTGEEEEDEDDDDPPEVDEKALMAAIEECEGEVELGRQGVHIDITIPEDVWDAILDAPHVFVEWVEQQLPEDD